MFVQAKFQKEHMETFPMALISQQLNILGAKAKLPCNFELPVCGSKTPLCS